MSSLAYPSEFADSLAAAANDVGFGEPRYRDPKHSVIVSAHVARILENPAVVLQVFIK